MREKAIEEQMVAVKDVVMEPTMKTLSDDLVCPAEGLGHTKCMLSPLEEEPCAQSQLRVSGVFVFCGWE